MIAKAIKRAINKHFDQAEDGFVFIVQDQKKPPPENAPYAHLRVYDIDESEVTRVPVMVSIVVTVPIANPLYSIDEILDKLSVQMKLGIDVLNGETSIGCLRLETGPRIKHFGRIFSSSPYTQSTIEGTYEGDLGG